MKLPLVSSWFHGFLARTPAQACNAPTSHSLVPLHKGVTLEVLQSAGQCIVCLEGGVWITHDGDCRDVILKAGERYTSDRTARMLVHGLAASKVLVRAVAQADLSITT